MWKAEAKFGMLMTSKEEVEGFIKVALIGPNRMSPLEENH